ncbi:hypothetical protein KKJ22_18620 [Xenorhabdus bovienii]|uniref:hypothetical protein n=1 Tax=Xenorhabdus bovienii TaxID=40576 RepID=UPI0023B20C63|nr:hypothetical protein [Xenorhabdus bovienii]MDE9499768.1 hypothetical protein [Xenorhabdus bovienii]
MRWPEQCFLADADHFDGKPCRLCLCPDSAIPTACRQQADWQATDWILPPTG